MTTASHDVPISWTPAQCSLDSRQCPRLRSCHARNRSHGKIPVVEQRTRCISGSNCRCPLSGPSTLPSSCHDEKPNSPIHIERLCSPDRDVSPMSKSASPKSTPPLSPLISAGVRYDFFPTPPRLACNAHSTRQLRHFKPTSPFSRRAMRVRQVQLRLENSCVCGAMVRRNLHASGALCTSSRGTLSATPPTDASQKRSTNNGRTLDRDSPKLESHRLSERKYSHLRPNGSLYRRGERVTQGGSNGGFRAVTEGRIRRPGRRPHDVFRNRTADRGVRLRRRPHEGQVGGCDRVPWEVDDRHVGLERWNSSDVVDCQASNAEGDRRGNAWARRVQFEY